jgi:hypothetical protein
MAELPVYIHLEPSGPLPDLAHLSPFRAMVVVEAFVTAAWQDAASSWLVQSGCLYMMAWGQHCSSWDDSVDMANLEHFEFGDIPEDRSVMTTWHTDEPLSEAMSFCKRHATHPTVSLSHTVLLHIAECSDAERLLKEYAEA